MIYYTFQLLIKENFYLKDNPKHRNKKRESYPQQHLKKRRLPVVRKKIRQERNR